MAKDIVKYIYIFKRFMMYADVKRLVYFQMWNLFSMYTFIIKFLDTNINLKHHDFRER